MALIKCPECGKEISDKSKCCIHCGFPMDELKQQSISTENTECDIYTAPPITEKYKVILTDAGINKTRIIEELEDLCNYSSIQATKIINSLPQVIIETISYDTAKHIKDVLSEIGAYVSLKTEKCNILVEIEPDSPDYQYFGIKVLNTENAPQHIKTLLLNARLLNQNVTKIEYKDIIASGLPFDKAETFVEYLKKNNVLWTIFKDTFNNSLNTSMIEFIVNHSIQDNLVHCPRCGSTQITTGQRGFSFWTGFIGANKTVNRCANCGHHWTP